MGVSRDGWVGVRGKEEGLCAGDAFGGGWEECCSVVALQ